MATSLRITFTQTSRALKLQFLWKSIRPLLLLLTRRPSNWKPPSRSRWA